MKNYEADIEKITLVPYQGGCFEVTANDRLLYSKLHTDRHAEPGEVLGLIKKYLQENA